MQTSGYEGLQYSSSDCLGGTEDGGCEFIEVAGFGATTCSVGFWFSGSAVAKDE